MIAWLHSSFCWLWSLSCWTWSWHQGISLFAESVIGISLAVIAVHDFFKTKGSNMDVTYYTKTDMDERTRKFIKQTNYATIRKDVNLINSPYICTVFIRNNKNKPELIEKIFLQIENKITVLLKDYKYEPLAIKPFDGERILFKPVTFYTKKDDSFAYTNDKDSNEDIFVSKKNKIIIKTSKGMCYGFAKNINETLRDNVYIERSSFGNVKSSLLTSRKMKNCLDNCMKPVSEVSKYGDVLPYNILCASLMEIENKPLEIEKGTFYRFIEDKINEAEKFGLQIAISRDDDCIVNYYCVSKEGEKYLIPFHPNMDKSKIKYKNYLDKTRRIDSFQIFYEHLKKNLEKRKVKMIDGTPYSFSYTMTAGSLSEEVECKRNPEMKDRFQETAFFDVNKMPLTVVEAREFSKNLSSMTLQKFLEKSKCQRRSSLLSSALFYIICSILPSFFFKRVKKKNNFT